MSFKSIGPSIQSCNNTILLPPYKNTSSMNYYISLIFVRLQKPKMFRLFWSNIIYFGHLCDDKITDVILNSTVD